MGLVITNVVHTATKQLTLIHGNICLIFLFLRQTVKNFIFGDSIEVIKHTTANNAYKHDWSRGFYSKIIIMG